MLKKDDILPKPLIHKATQSLQTHHTEDLISLEILTPDIPIDPMLTILYTQTSANNNHLS